VDRQWTAQHLLPLFDWQGVVAGEALAVWTGFLWAPRLYEPLLKALKAPFIAVASHYTELGPCGRQYASLLTYAGLEGVSAISRAELAAAMSNLPADGLARIAQTLVQALQSAGEQRAEYWHNRVRPFLHFIWPKSTAARTQAIKKSFAQLSIASGNAFPEAVAELRYWLGPLDQPDLILDEFRENRFAERFPRESLEYLDLVLLQGSFLTLVRQLAECLDAIRQRLPELGTDPRLQKLETIVRQRGGA